jgi:ParB family chromosome partitioning protein
MTYFGCELQIEEKMTTTAEKAMSAGEKVATAEADKVVPEKRRALGRGLESLLPSGPRAVGGSAVSLEGGAGAAAAVAPVVGQAREKLEPHEGVVPEIHAQAARAAGGEAVIQIKLEEIDHNPYQTRYHFDQDAMTDMAESIRASGVVQPIVVRPGADRRYVLILGERRCRASKLAGQTTIPAIVRRVSDQQAAEMTVVENLQRQDLNCMEQAEAFGKLSQTFSMTQEQIGQRVGLSRESVSNYMRLLKLPGSVMQYLLDGALGFSEARELLKLPDNETIAEIAREAVEKSLSFVQLMDRIEGITIKIHQRPDATPPRGARWVDPNVRAAQAALERLLGMRVRISDRKGKGKITIEYANLDHFDRLLVLLKGKV